MATRSHTQRVTEQALVAATGHGWDEWYGRLDAAGASGWTHNAIATWLVDGGMTPWWAQGVTIAYEQERGLREPGQRSDGTFGVSVSKAVTIDQRGALDAAVEVLIAEFGEPGSTSLHGKYLGARWRLSSGEHIELTADPVKQDRSRLVLAAETLPGPEAIGPWRGRLRRLLAEAARELE